MTSAVRTLLLALVLLVLAVPAAVNAQGGPPEGKADKAQTTEVQILGLNDFHGNLEPPAGSGGRIGALTDIDPGPGTNLQCVEPTCYLAGGIEYLATHVRELEKTNPNSVFVSAGDLIGATPLLSALFHDEPTIEGFNAMGLDFNGVGNHEFDEGIDELLRMQNGGCHPVDGCLDGDGFAGSDFQFLAANVKYKSNGETIFPPYAIKKFKGGIEIAFVGMTLEGTPSIVSPGGISTVDFFDEADSVNALVPVLKRQGVETIVVLLHEGGTTTNSQGVGTVAAINECNALSGALPPIVERMDDEIDVVVTGHTNWAVNCVVDGKIVTGAAHQGRLVTDIDLTISRATKDVVSAKVNNHIVTRTVAKAPDLTALIAKYQTIAAPIANRVIGRITADITRATTPAGESALGDVIADAQLDATKAADRGAAVVAFMNPGGIRADLIYAGSPAGEGDGNVTYGEMFSVQPFGNSMVTMTLTGAQIERLLEEQFAGCTLPSARVLQVSVGFTYTWKLSGPVCDKVDPATIKIGTTTVSPTASYRVTVNSFLAEGGDSFPILVQGTNRLGGEVDTDALERYIATNSPVAPGPRNRITQVP